MARSEHWGPAPQGRGTPAGKFSPGKAVGEDSLGSAVGELRHQHPHDVQGEGLHHKSYNARHQPVTSSVYGSRK
jgi:hypothetical protein